MKELLQFIHELSTKDPKTLPQKALKTQEEVGELAKAILPFTEAPDSSHRFSDKNKILEECADVILCALSVAYNLGSTNEEIESMLWDKSQYWASLQKREKKNPFPLPFELHVTVSPDSNMQSFKNVCKEIGVKATILELFDNKGKKVLDDAMTSSHFFGNNQEAYEKLNEIKNKLQRNGFDVIREKIETVPWHPAAPSNKGNKKHRNSYFESHTDVFVEKKQEKIIKKMIKEKGYGLSQNTKKVFEEGSIMSITVRDYSCSFEDFELKVKDLEFQLDKFNIKRDKTLSEFAIYDTKISHDKDWLKK